MPPLQCNVRLIRTQPPLYVSVSCASQLVDNVIHLLSFVQMNTLPVPCLQVVLIRVERVPTDVL